MNLVNRYSYRIKLFLIFVIHFFLVQNNFCFALDSESDREKIFSSFSRKLYQTKTSRTSILVSGNYDSDYNSKEIRSDIRAYYKSSTQSHEINFINEVNYSNLGTTIGKTYRVKRSELYDTIIASKFKLFETKNYIVAFGRLNYNDMSNYYYDHRQALGVGKSFYKDNLEFDLSIGQMDIKNTGYKIFIMPTYRINVDLSKKVTFTQRGYIFFDHESMDNDLRTTLKYKLSKKTSMALNHTFEQRQYDNNAKNQADRINRTRRYISIGLNYSF